jgi:hypothetical protein
MAEIFWEEPDKWVRFTCDCYMHVLDLSCYHYGEEGKEIPWIELTCLPLDHQENKFWDRLKLSVLYLIGRNKDKHAFWNFIMRKDDVKAFKEFVASLPEEKTARDELVEFQAKQFNLGTRGASKEETYKVSDRAKE